MAESIATRIRARPANESCYRLGQDPLLFMLASSPLPEVSELDIAGGLRGEPIEVIRGPYTGFPIPADAEIVLEGETASGQLLPEGPFGEWMGYYSDDTKRARL